MFILPLSLKDLNEATELANKLFPADLDNSDPPAASIEASLEPKKYADY